MERITSAKNAHVKHVKQLINNAKARRESGLFVVEGRRLCGEARLDLLKEVYISEDYEHTVPAAEDGMNFRITEEVFTSMTDTKTPQGVLMVLKQPVWPQEGFFRKDGLYLFLETIQDPGNLGTIFRTAEAAGVSGIVMNRECADLFSPKTIRSTMGSIFRMPYLMTEDLFYTMRLARTFGVRLYAADLRGKENYTEADFSTGTAFVIGNEGNGLTPEARSQSDHLIKIPMDGEVDSLNAGVAAAVLLFEAKRQRKA